MAEAEDRGLPAPGLPDQDDPCGCWNAYVAAGDSREDRRQRLADCPDRCRETVETHVRGVFDLMREKRGG